MKPRSVISIEMSIRDLQSLKNFQEPFGAPFLA